MSQEPDSTGTEARDYLADDFDEQAADSPPEHAQGYRDFADYLRALPADDGHVAELSELLRPFLEDDTRLGGTLYPDGDAIRFMDSLVPDADPEACGEYLDEFLGHLQADHRRWLAHVAARGADAEWTLETGRPEPGVCLAHFETAPTTAPPQYESWEHYLAATTPAERRAMCRTRTKKANAPRLMSEAPERRLTADDVWQIVETAQGRCHYCGSLCLEKLPYDPETKKKLPWGHVGRRIGSLNHITSRVLGGTNDHANLAWSCLWCNTWACERTAGAADHGGLQPVGR
jgi:hypothetical protein